MIKMKKENDIKDYNDYHSGRRIASQIGDVMEYHETPHEELDQWLNDKESSGAVVERLSSEEILTEMCNHFEQEEKHSRSKHLTDVLKKRCSKVHKVRYLRVLSSLCAAALLVVSLLVYTFMEPQSTENHVAATLTTGTIENSYTKPTLILNNGVNIDLTKISTINLSDRKDTLLRVDTVKYNRIVIPKEYNYTAVLEDGTTVHLNACSELHYPSRFTGEKREVFLSGEAFFEVTKDSKPFIINTNDISVRVYGTKFNINTHNCNNIQTVLIEGSVSVKQEGDTTETFIKPNQMLTIDKNGNKTVHEILPERYTAWMDGFIRSDEESMTNLLDNIAKWYGIEFIYSEEIQNIEISASLKRERPLSEIIKAIVEISGVKITKINEETYMVK